MSKRPLGNSGIKIAPLALGGNVFGWTIDQKTSFEILDAFVDFGFDLTETANVYSTWVPGKLASRRVNSISCKLSRPNKGWNPFVSGYWCKGVCQGLFGGSDNIFDLSPGNRPLGEMVSGLAAHLPAPIEVPLNTCMNKLGFI